MESAVQTTIRSPLFTPILRIHFVVVRSDVGHGFEWLTGHLIQLGKAPVFSRGLADLALGHLKAMSDENDTGVTG